MIDLSHKNALITGSARGLGRDIALSLAGCGANVVIHYYKSRDRAEGLVHQIRNLGRQAFSFSADLTKFGQVNNLFQKVQQRYGSVDILINNVGNFLQKSLDQTSIQEWHDILESNLNSTFYCCKAALPLMRRQQYGRIINIALANADRIQAFKNITPYAIAKTGVLILTRSLAVEEAKNNITVNAVSPGLYDNGSLTKSEILAHSRHVPQGRVGRAHDLIGAIHYLLSDEAEYVTGANIIVSGGWGL